MVISVVKVLSVVHFWLKVRPRSHILYFVSRWPPDFPVSVLLEPEVENSCRDKEGCCSEGEVQVRMQRGDEANEKRSSRGKPLPRIQGQVCKRRTESWKIKLMRETEG